MIGPSSSPPEVTGSDGDDCSSLAWVSGASSVLVTVAGGGLTVAVTVAVEVTTVVVVAGGAMGASPAQPARSSSTGTVIDTAIENVVGAATLEILMTTPLLMGGARGAVAGGACPVRPIPHREDARPIGVVAPPLTEF